MQPDRNIVISQNQSQLCVASNQTLLGGRDVIPDLYFVCFCHAARGCDTDGNLLSVLKVVAVLLVNGDGCRIGCGDCGDQARYWLLPIHIDHLQKKMCWTGWQWCKETVDHWHSCGTQCPFSDYEKRQ